MKKTKQPTLYRFKLDPATGKITRYDITSYEEIPKVHLRDSCYRFRLNGTLYYAYFSSIDKMKNDTVYSFNPYVEHARAIMLDTLSKKWSNALNQADKYQRQYYKVKEAVDG